MIGSEVLIVQIDALINNLQRIQDLFTRKKVKERYTQHIYGKFFRTISPYKHRLTALKDRLLRNKDRLGQDELNQIWSDYTQIRQRCQRIFGQCLDFLGGIALREMELEEGICDLAEQMVSQFSADIGGDWLSVMILGEDRLFDDVAYTTQIIRLRFPQWDIWSIPFAAYEYGQLVYSQMAQGSEDDESPRLRQFTSDELRRIGEFIETPSMLPETFDALAPDIRQMREQYLARKVSKADVAEFLDQQRSHIRNLFADMFATYFLGPAYLFSRFYLRLIATDAFQSQAYKPSSARRMAVMLNTLAEMNKEAKAEQRDEFASGIYDNELKRLTTLWRTTIQALNPEYQGELQFGLPYDRWFSELYSLLQNSYDDVGFAQRDWENAMDFSTLLLTDGTLGPIKKLPVVLNAAWLARIQKPDQAADIEKKICKLYMQQLSAGAVVPPAGGQQTRV